MTRRDSGRIDCATNVVGLGRPPTELSKRTQLAVDAEVGSAKGSCAGKVGQAHGGL